MNSFFSFSTKNNFVVCCFWASTVNFYVSEYFNKFVGCSLSFLDLTNIFKLNFRHLSNLRFCQLKQQIMNDSPSVLVEMTLKCVTSVHHWRSHPAPSGYPTTNWNRRQRQSDTQSVFFLVDNWQNAYE